VNEAELERYWWLVANGGEWVPICREHPDCLKAYPRRLAAAKKLSGGCGVWGSPHRGYRGRFDVEACYDGGRYYFRWLPAPEFVAFDRLTDAWMSKPQRVPDDG
jgi:hypothetical protein